MFEKLKMTVYDNLKIYQHAKNNIIIKVNIKIIVYNVRKAWILVCTNKLNQKNNRRTVNHSPMIFPKCFVPIQGKLPDC